MIVSEKDAFGETIVFKWELLESEFLHALDGRPEIKDKQAFWDANKDSILQGFQRGFEVLVEDYDYLIGDAINDALEDDE